MKQKKEIYFSVDIEANGPIPGRFSMLSIGVAACVPHEGILRRWSANFEEIPGSMQDPDTMEWWSKYPQAYAETRRDTVEPMRAMLDFHEFVHDTCREANGKPVMVAYPAGFDFTFTHWYFLEYTNHDPFGFQCIDMKTYAMAKLNQRFKETVKRNMPKEWFNFEAKHSHIALDDAIEQAHLWLAMENYYNY